MPTEPNNANASQTNPGDGHQRPPVPFSLVLHAHLPFVRHPEQVGLLEEDWLFEAVIESYVPLFSRLEDLAAEGVPFSLSLSLSPTLIALLDDALLRKRFQLHLDKLLLLAHAQKQNARTNIDTSIASHDLFRLEQIRDRLRAWNHDVLTPVRALQNSDRIDVLACAATHALLPLISNEGGRRAQVRAGIAATTRAMGKRPRGFWLPECGFDHGVDAVLVAEGVEFSFLDAHALVRAEPRAEGSAHRAFRTPAGLVVFPRDPNTAEAVWSADHGYPGHPAYREFHRDLGNEADYDYIRPYLHADGVRRPLGIKRHRVTGKGIPLDQKALYDPEGAQIQARQHAKQFVSDRVQQARLLTEDASSITACFDAELFGHWWFEGPVFLEAVVRGVADNSSALALTTPARLVSGRQRLQTICPEPSTWGFEGHNRAWLAPKNAWLYRYQHWAEAEMKRLAPRARGRGGLLERTARQAARELLMMQSSDWAFMISTGASESYPTRRFKDHFLSFKLLLESINNKQLDERTVSARESRTPLFHNLDLRSWS